MSSHRALAPSLLAYLRAVASGIRVRLHNIDCAQLCKLLDRRTRVAFEVVVNEALAALDAEFAQLYAAGGRPSIAPEKLLRGSLIQAFFSIRSERQLLEQLNYNLLFRWFVALGLTEIRGHASNVRLS
jgi:hypothetical protein